jgi:hypothetical protein
MEFLYISSLGTTYRYAVKIEKKLKKRHGNLGLGTPHNKSQERVAPNHRTKDKENMDSIRTTSPSRKQRRTSERQRKIPGSGATSIRALGITLPTSTQRSHLVAKVKASESDAGSDSEPEPERGRQIIDVEPSATVATTKLQPSEPEEPEEGERLFHS